MGWVEARRHIPNALTILRFAAIPVFVVALLGAGDGRGVGGRHLLRRRCADGPARRVPRAPLARRVGVREGRGPARRPAHDRRRGRPALARGAAAARRDADRARPRPRPRRSGTSSSSRAATSSRSASSASSPRGSSTRRSASSSSRRRARTGRSCCSGSASRSPSLAAAEYVLRARRTLAEPR